MSKLKLTSIVKRGPDAKPRVERPIKKTDAEQQLVFAEVYAPMLVDAHEDFMSAETIRNMAYDFMRKGLTDAVDTNHDREKNGSYIVESFIARDDDTIFIPGSWVVGIKVDNETWALVKSGEINGFSLDGMGVKNPTTLEINIPSSIVGETDEGSDGENLHKHKFIVTFNEDGDFVGGNTTVALDGHFHRIVNGTITEAAGTPPHTHRYAFVEGIIEANEVVDG